jgi:hypothetical protein
MNKKLFILIIGFFLISFICAVETELGTFKAGDDILLLQLCSNCTYNNITFVTAPNSSELISNVIMTKDETKFTYSLDKNYTTESGIYIVNGIGDLNGVQTIWRYTFEVTPNGEAPSSSKVIIQIGLLTFLILLFIFSLIGLFKFEDYKGRFVLYWICHILVIATTFISWQMSNDYLTGTPMIAGMFKIFFYISMIGSFPMIILSLSWIFYIHTVNDDIKKMMERGMDEGEAYDRARSKKRW